MKLIHWILLLNYWLILSVEEAIEKPETLTDWHKIVYKPNMYDDKIQAGLHYIAKIYGFGFFTLINSNSTRMMSLIPFSAGLGIRYFSHYFYARRFGFDHSTAIQYTKDWNVRNDDFLLPLPVVVLSSALCTAGFLTFLFPKKSTKRPLLTAAGLGLIGFEYSRGLYNAYKDFKIHRKEIFPDSIKIKD